MNIPHLNDDDTLAMTAQQNAAIAAAASAAGRKLTDTEKLRIIGDVQRQWKLSAAFASPQIQGINGQTFTLLDKSQTQAQREAAAVANDRSLFRVFGSAVVDETVKTPAKIGGAVGGAIEGAGSSFFGNLGVSGWVVLAVAAGVAGWLVYKGKVL